MPMIKKVMHFPGFALDAVQFFDRVLTGERGIVLDTEPRSWPIGQVRCAFQLAAQNCLGLDARPIG